MQSVPALFFRRACHSSKGTGTCRLYCCSCFYVGSNAGSFGRWHDLLRHEDQATVGSGFAPWGFKPSCHRAPVCSRLTLGARAMGDRKSVCNCTLQRRRKNLESLYVHRFQVCRKFCCGTVRSFAGDANGMDSELCGKVLPSEMD